MMRSGLSHACSSKYLFASNLFPIFLRASSLHASFSPPCVQCVRSGAPNHAAHTATHSLPFPDRARKWKCSPSVRLPIPPGRSWMALLVAGHPQRRWEGVPKMGQHHLTTARREESVTLQPAPSALGMIYLQPATTRPRRPPSWPSSPRCPELQAPPSLRPPKRPAESLASRARAKASCPILSGVGLLLELLRMVVAPNLRWDNPTVLILLPLVVQASWQLREAGEAAVKTI